MVCLAGSHRPRLSAFIGLCLLIAGTWLLVPGTTPTYGQDGEGAAPAQTPTTPASGEASASEGRKQKQSLFWHIIYSAGPVFGPMLLVISIILVALIVLLLMDLRLGNAVPPGFVEEFTDTVNKRRFKEAFDLARADSSFLGRVLTAGMGRLQYGIEDAREAALNMVENIKANKEQLITYLATIGTLGPMIGLVGTVYGMILAFMELSTGAQPRPDKLADGISHALVITLLGVAISVPAIFFHAMFKNRVIHIANDVSNIADDLLTQMYHNSKKAGAPAGAPTVAATPSPDSRSPTAPATVKPS